MTTIRPAPRRTDTSDHVADSLHGYRYASSGHHGEVARASALVSAGIAAGCGHDDGRPDAASPGSGHADLNRLLPVFHRLVDDTVTQVLACPAKPDPAFEGFEELLAPIRSATTLEGNLLERGIKAICACRNDLIVVPLEAPLPVLPEAKAFLRRNDWSKAAALRLGSEVHTREFYRPDLLVVDAHQHRALILDIKRSVLSHKPKALLELRTRMMAAALVARDWLERECDAPAVERVEIAIVDGSGELADHAKAIFAMSDLDALLGIVGASEAIDALRRLYGERIREIMLERCKAVVRSMTPGSVGKAAQHNEIGRADLGEDAWAEDEEAETGSAEMPRTASPFVRVCPGPPRQCRHRFRGRPGMSGNNERGIDQSGPMQNDRAVVSLQEWRANQAAGPDCASAADAVTTSAPSTSPRRFDPAMMPEPSANQKRFMEIMSGDESDPAFAVGVVLFFWRFSRRGMPMPKRALALLDRHAAAGDPACILVRDWLAKKMVKSGKRSLWVFAGGKA